MKELGIPVRDADYCHSGRVGRIMKKLGWQMVCERGDGEDRVVFKNLRYDTGKLTEAPKQEAMTGNGSFPLQLHRLG